MAELRRSGSTKSNWRVPRATLPDKQITAFGTAVRWPDLDEDVGLAGILGVPEELVDEGAGFEVRRRKT
jgi:hypothetical protein